MALDAGTAWYSILQIDSIIGCISNIYGKIVSLHYELSY